MKDFNCDVEINARVEYKYIKGDLITEPECIIKAYAQIRVKALREALQRAEREGLTKPCDVVEIDLYSSLTISERAAIEDACDEDDMGN
jgi:hypothetical protein